MHVRDTCDDELGHNISELLSSSVIESKKETGLKPIEQIQFVDLVLGT